MVLRSSKRSQVSQAACAQRAFDRCGLRLAATLLLLVLPGMLVAWQASAETGIRKEIQCLALNIYFEARSEPEAGKYAVGHVVLNRVADPRYPDSICEVVQEGGQETLHRCQFSWWCDGESDLPTEAAAWQQSKMIANYVYWGFSKDPTFGALWYHADYVRPSWRRALLRGPEIGRHIFYHKADEAALEQAEQMRESLMTQFAVDGVPQPKSRPAADRRS